MCSTSAQASNVFTLSPHILSAEKLNSEDDDMKKKKLKKFTISGYITEAGSGENLFSVSVYIPELKIGGTTNTYGFYSLTLPKGIPLLNM